MLLYIKGKFTMGKLILSLDYSLLVNINVEVMV